MTVTPTTTLQVSEFGQLEQIGTGQYGYVYKAIHRPTQRVMAIKKTLCSNEHYNQLSKFWDFILDLNLSRQEDGRDCIVDFYGTIFFDSDCWLCMELMDVSLDKFIQLIYSNHDGQHFVPEFVIAQIARSMVMALNFLELHSYKLRRKSYAALKNSHGAAGCTTPYADVKTSNVLISRNGDIKLCDLGMCRRLVNPTASIQGGEWFHYVAPERICPGPVSQSELDSPEFRVDQRADVWALGISLYETATGVLPFHDVKLAFQVIAAIVNGPSPQLEAMDCRRSSQMTSFVNSCLTKNFRERPSFQELFEHPFMESAQADRDVGKLAGYFSTVLDLVPSSEVQSNMQDNN